MSFIHFYKEVYQTRSKQDIAEQIHRIKAFKYYSKNDFDYFLKIIFLSEFPHEITEKLVQRLSFKEKENLDRFTIENLAYRVNKLIFQSPRSHRNYQIR